MSTLTDADEQRLSEATALIVGLGGLGSPAARILIEAGVGRLVLVDDDIVDETNLHRQILFEDTDVGRSKLEAGKERLSQYARATQRIECVPTRLLPDNARQLAANTDVILEGADNYATKFLAADASYLEKRPVVHGAALGFVGTAWAVARDGAPCYRCLFEDLPQGAAATCSSAGVMGPVVGFVAALMADLALGILLGTPKYGVLLDFDGKRDRLRQVTIPPRQDCALCGVGASILEIEEARYARQICAA